MLLLPRPSPAEYGPRTSPPDDSKGYLLRGAVEAPRVCELVANSYEMDNRQHEPVYVLRSIAGESTLSVINEAEALQDLHDNLGRFAEKSQSAEYADKPTLQLAGEKIGQLLQELRFLGAHERERASCAIADNWAHRLRHSKPGKQLRVGVAPNASSLQVFQEVRDILDTDHPDIAERVIGVNIETLISTPRQNKRRIAAEGLILLDDWSISGNQMRDTIDALNNYKLFDRPFPKKGLEIHLLSAPASHLRFGIGGVTCRAFFRHNFNRFVNTTASITGAHSDTDFGFANTIDKGFDEVAGQMRLTGVSRPLLTKISCQYRPTDSIDKKHTLTPEESKVHMAGVDRLLGTSLNLVPAEDA